MQTLHETLQIKPKHLKETINEAVDIQRYPRIAKYFNILNDSTKKEVLSIFNTAFNASTYSDKEYKFVESMASAIRNELEFVHNAPYSKDFAESLSTLKVTLKALDERLWKAKPNMDTRDLFFYFLQDLDIFLGQLPDDGKFFKCIGSNTYKIGSNRSVNFVLVYAIPDFISQTDLKKICASFASRYKWFGYNVRTKDFTIEITEEPLH